MIIAILQVSLVVQGVQDGQHGRCIANEENPQSLKQGTMCGLHQIQAI